MGLRWDEWGVVLEVSLRLWWRHLADRESGLFVRCLLDVLGILGAYWLPKFILRYVVSCAKYVLYCKYFSMATTFQAYEESTQEAPAILRSPV